jgi:hypothetical protein
MRVSLHIMHCPTPVHMPKYGTWAARPKPLAWCMASKRGQMQNMPPLVALESMLLEPSDEDSAALAKRGGGSATALQVHRLRPRRTLLLGGANGCVPSAVRAVSPTAPAIALSCEAAPRKRRPANTTLAVRAVDGSNA